MKTKAKHPEPVSRTIQSKTKAAKQAPISQILQRYKAQTIQRQDMDEDELLQGKFDDTTQRMESDEDEEISIQAINRTGLPDNLKAGVENLSGYSMDDVRVHYNSSKPAQLQALAYTQGTDIHVAPGQEKHLPHEAWHVVQQKQGRVQPTMQLQGVNVNDNEGLEREADVMEKKAVQRRENIVQLKTNGMIQCHMGSRQGDINHVCKCKSTVHYKVRGKGTGVKHNDGSGGNDRNTKSEVLECFMKHGLSELFIINEKDNPPGQCAEPHAVADALSSIPNIATIESISVEQATKPDGMLKKRCKTCKQWVPGNKVEKKFLIQKRY